MWPRTKQIEKFVRASGEAILGTLKYVSMQSPLSKHCIVGISKTTSEIPTLKLGTI